MSIDRQTRARAIHPTLGPGLAIYENGPASFVADSGAVEEMAKIGFGGSSKAHNFIVATTRAGQRIEMATTGLQGGEHHQRRWSPIFGPGWLVHLPSLALLPESERTPVFMARWRASLGLTRFDPDAGEPVSFQWDECHVGRLGKKPRSKTDKAEAEHWTTYGSFEFRDTAPTVVEPKQVAMGGAA